MLRGKYEEQPLKLKLAMVREELIFTTRLAAGIWGDILVLAKDAAENV